MPSSGIYVQLKGNILKTYTVELIFNAQSQLGAFIFPREPLTPSHSNCITLSSLPPPTHIPGPFHHTSFSNLRAKEFHPTDEQKPNPKHDEEVWL
jgi:hypothetical protein